MPSRTQFETNVLVDIIFNFILFVSTGVQNMPAPKKVISVYVDVGECTDAIQHKDRGDFQVTTTPLLSFYSQWLQRIYDSIVGGLFLKKKNYYLFSKNTSNFSFTSVLYLKREYLIC